MLGAFFLLSLPIDSYFFCPYLLPVLKCCTVSVVFGLHDYFVHCNMSPNINTINIFLAIEWFGHRVCRVCLCFHSLRECFQKGLHEERKWRLMGGVAGSSFLALGKAFDEAKASVDNQPHCFVLVPFSTRTLTTSVHSTQFLTEESMLRMTPRAAAFCPPLSCKVHLQARPG